MTSTLLSWAILLGATPTPTPTWFEKFVKDNPGYFALGLVASVALIAIAAAIPLTVFLKTRNENRKGQTATPANDPFRDVVARTVLTFSIWGLILVAIVPALLFKSSDPKETLNVLLPVFGTWVGTLLAYYFGKDNFESGAKMATTALTGQEKLQSIPVTTVMIPVSGIELPQEVRDHADHYDQIHLAVVSTQMETSKRERLPLINPANGAAVAVLHKSLIDRFLIRKSTANPPVALADVTLQQLLDDLQAGKVAKDSFVVIPNTATLADAKAAMTQKSTPDLTCEDAFVTAPGSTKVLGWITSDIINENSKVERTRSNAE
jgi:hypothetical protein